MSDAVLGYMFLGVVVMTNSVTIALLQRRIAKLQTRISLIEGFLIL